MGRIVRPAESVSVLWVLVPERQLALRRIARTVLPSLIRKRSVVRVHHPEFRSS